MADRLTAAPRPRLPAPAAAGTDRSRRAALAALGAGALGLAGGATPAPARAQPAAAFPSRPIRFVVPYPPGGPLDQVARMLADAVREPLGQPLIVENRAGAGGNIGADLVAKAAPDGHTILMGAVATHAINPALYARMPYDANRDFAPVVRVAVVPNVLVLHPATAERLAIGSVRDLIAHARRHPGRLNYASGGNGSAGHLAGELFKTLAGVSMVHIPYAGAGPALAGLAGGQTDLMFDNLASAAPQIRAGRLKPLAVTTAQRNSRFPELPTVAESGLPGFDVSTWFGIFAPAGTAPAIVERLHAEFERAMGRTELKERFAGLGADPAPLAPAPFEAFVRSEQAKYEKVVRASGARVD